jgi:hypothetical protein
MMQKEHEMIARIILLCMAASLSVSAQITITNTDFSNMFAIGNGTTIREDTIGAAVDIGSPDVVNNWDFSWFEPDLIYDMVSVDPASTPHTGEFPGAEIATYHQGDYEGDEAEIWGYYTLNGTFENLGSAMVLSSLDNVLVTIKNNPARIEAALPITLNSSWSQSFTQTVSFSGFQFSSSVSLNVTVDAYGTMTLPGGAVFEALRMRETMTVSAFGQQMTSVTYSFISKNGAHVSVYAADENPPSNGVINAAEFSWNFEFTTVDIRFTVTYPSTNDIVIAGERDSILYMHWNGDVDLYYSLDDGMNFTLIDSSYSSPVGTYYWDIPDSLLTTKAIIKAVDSSPDTAKSRVFKIKPWQLSRMDANDDFELYVPDEDGWSFSNSGNNMWPSVWWNQFDYQSGTDPYTNVWYPPIPPFITAADSLFPDWPLFVDVFGTASSYFSFQPLPIYRPKALRRWNRFNSAWGGSCFGFAVSSLLGFYHDGELRQQIGAFDDLFTASLNNNSRYAINYFQMTQYGEEINEYRRENTSKTPQQLLDELKEMFRKENGDGRPLRYPNTNGSGGHAVVPYKLERVDSTSTFNVWVYNPNNPGDLSQFILIDSVANTWSDSTSLNWGGGTSDCYLHYESYFFLNTPTLNIIPLNTVLDKENSNGSGRITVYNTHEAEIIITSETGEDIGYQNDIAFNNMTDAVPIIPLTGYAHPPIGYDLPDHTYSLHLNNFTSAESYIMFETDATIYDYRRFDAESNQSDMLQVSGNGVKITNSDAVTKNIEFETILFDNITHEKVLILSNIDISAGDSLNIREKDRNELAFNNYGERMDYDLHIRIVSEDSQFIFEHSGIPIDQNSGHQIVPDWDDLRNEPVKILIDHGNDGTIDDSLFVSNQVTGVDNRESDEIPHAFMLHQNYPNPFNPETTIRFEVPQFSHIEIIVYDILGRKVETLVEQNYEPGIHHITWYTHDIPSGMYLYRIYVNGIPRETKRMMLLK